MVQGSRSPRVNELQGRKRGHPAWVLAGQKFQEPGLPSTERILCREGGRVHKRNHTHQSELRGLPHRNQIHPFHSLLTPEFSTDRVCSSLILWFGTGALYVDQAGSQRSAFFCLPECVDHHTRHFSQLFSYVCSKTFYLNYFSF